MSALVSDNQEAPEDGQFDDAPEEMAGSTAPPVNPREGGTFIDEERILEWSSDDSEEELDQFDADEDEMEAAAYDTLRAEDEDWEVAEGDFTKQYNRLRQHVAIRTGAALGVTSNTSQSSVASLPAVNRPRPSKPSPSTAPSGRAKDKTESQLQALSKYSSRLRNLDVPYDLGVGINRKGPSATANMKDKSDRATSEQVLDPRTRIILFKMIGRGLLFEVNGCVSTGKEANVYHALTPEQKHHALKIYKTSILVFKDRDRYVSGEYRFRRGYSRHNPRKMVRVWAEKEMRNLKRLQTAGIRCPEPVEVRENVLVMGFIGDKDGWASPRLKDADIPASEFQFLYVELVLMVRKMFHQCKLVHADLSEYNILYHVETTAPPETPAPSPCLNDTPCNTTPPQPEADTPEHKPHGHLYIIDVSQSVEHDHPHAFDFLRADLRNVEDFFSKRGVSCLGLRRAFEFVTRDKFDGEGDEETELRKRLDQAEHEPDQADGSAADEPNGDRSHTSSAHEDSVFMRSYIPRTLNEVYDPERDVGTLARGEGEKLIYKDTIGIVTPGDARSQGPHETKKSHVHFEGDGESEAGEGDESEGSEEDDGDSDSEDSGYQERKPRGHRHEDKTAKKARKQAVKAEAREKRKHKIPKAEKKRKVRTTARGK